jgi:hypothetical protein
VDEVAADDGALDYSVDMLQRIKTAVRFGLMAYVAYGIIYQFPC